MKHLTNSFSHYNIQRLMILNKKKTILYTTKHWALNGKGTSQPKLLAQIQHPEAWIQPVASSVEKSLTCLVLK